MRIACRPWIHHQPPMTRLPDYSITRLPNYQIQKMVLMEAAAQSSTRAGRMPR